MWFGFKKVEQIMVGVHHLQFETVWNALSWDWLNYWWKGQLIMHLDQEEGEGIEEKNE